MVSHRPAPGFLLRSVALRFQPRQVAAWSTPARRGPLPRPQPAESNTGPRKGSARRDQQTAMVEAVLLISAEPVASRRIVQVTGLADPTQARTLIRRLNDFYRREESPYCVEEVAGGWQLLTHPSFGGWLRRLHPSGFGIRLSAPALETLAVVAYRQPVLRAEVESIRGVQCGEMLRQLMDRGLVRIVGKSNDLGRPFLYGTTPRFLRTFGLRTLDDLPRAAQLRPLQNIATPTAMNEVIPGDRRDQDLSGLNQDLKEEQNT
jgi:segregation and condensation protein B